MKLISLFILFIFLPTYIWAGGIVESITMPHQVMVDTSIFTGFDEGQKVVILSTKNKVIVAIGRVKDKNTGVPNQVKVQIDEIVDNLMVMPGDEVELLDFNIFKDRQIPGFTSLTLSGDKVPSQYKELAYFGVFTSEGHPLDKKEVLVSPFQLQYGLFDRFSVKMVNALWLDGYANLGAKYQIIRNKRVKITMNTMGAYKVQSQDWIGQFGGVITIPSNSKFQSHFMVNVTFDPQYEEAKATKDLGLFKDSDIRSITEYITDRWNRVLYGPVYNVQLQTFGGTVSHMWIWDTFHMSLGIATKDFSHLSFNANNGYYYVYDLFWRF